MLSLAMYTAQAQTMVGNPSNPDINWVTTSEVSITPNPASDALTVSNVVGRYTIKNMLGQVVLEGNIDAAQPRVNVSELAKGNYILCLATGGKKTVNKMFVKN
ncbi:MAG: Secretion system C-terminal sorting domain [Flavipsychrobacter sp.]|nr:Secretion system C-terminal sorting domain [Flavipsychrobacter sp.]